MKTRIIAGICMLPFLVILYFGGKALIVAAFAVSVIGVTEFFRGFEAMNVHPSKEIAYAMSFLLYGGYLIFSWNNTMLMLWVILSVSISLLFGLNITKRGSFDSIATLAGIMYVVFFPFHIVLLDNTPYRILVWMIFIAAFGSDIFAYFTGFVIGKHKMAPHLSPKKTIEGAIGGVIGAGIIGAFFGIFVAKSLMADCIIIGVLGACISECGDLVASSFKRMMGIKDYGHLIPGHGGVLDRFDSVIFLAPAVYYYVEVFMQKGL